MRSKKTIVMLFAASAAGLLAVPAPAQASPRDPFPLAPACNRWKLDDSVMTMNLNNGVVVTVPWSRGSQFVGTADATLHSPGGTVDWHGPRRRNRPQREQDKHKCPVDQRLSRGGQLRGRMGVGSAKHLHRHHRSSVEAR